MIPWRFSRPKDPLICHGRIAVFAVFPGKSFIEGDRWVAEALGNRCSDRERLLSENTDFTDRTTTQEVVPAPSAVGVAVGVLAAEAVEVVRGHEAPWADPCRRVRSWTSSLPIGRIPFNTDRTPPGFQTG